jgi:hypothetical protein
MRSSTHSPISKERQTRGPLQSDRQALENAGSGRGFRLNLCDDETAHFLIELAIQIDSCMVDPLVPPLRKLESERGRLTRALRNARKAKKEYLIDAVERALNEVEGQLKAHELGVGESASYYNAQTKRENIWRMYDIWKEHGGKGNGFYMTSEEPRRLAGPMIRLVEEAFKQAGIPEDRWPDPQTIRRIV